MCALRTPCFSADTHDSSFGIMPSEILPSAISCSMPADVDARDQRRLVGPVAVHAGDVGEVHELLGVERLGDRARDRVGVDVVRLAVVVDADGRDHRDQLLAQQPLDDRGVDRRARRRRSRAADRAGRRGSSPASSPDSPTAYEPCRFTDATISRLTLPTSAMRTMSTVSASVTRRPSTNSGSLPSRRMRSVICGPPPCTTTGFMPTSRMSTTSVANRSASVGVVHRVAAVLDHDGLARELADVRQRLGEDDAPSRPRSRTRRVAIGAVTTCAGSRRCTRARGRW